MKFLQLAGSENNHQMINPIVDCAKLYKYTYRTKPAGGRHDAVMLAPYCEDRSSVYMVAPYRTFTAETIEQAKQYIVDLLHYIKKIPDGSIVRTYRRNYAEADMHGDVRTVEIEPDWVMEIIE